MLNYGKTDHGKTDQSTICIRNDAFESIKVQKKIQKSHSGQENYSACKQRTSNRFESCTDGFIWTHQRVDN